MKSILEVIEWAKEEIENNKDLLRDEPNTSHSYSAYLEANDTLYRLLEFIEDDAR
jgi:NAD-dependent SIR2 family protein deacetylase